MEHLNQSASNSENFTDNEEENNVNVNGAPSNTEDTVKINLGVPQRHLSFSVENILAPGRFGHHGFSRDLLSNFDDGKTLNLLH